MSTECEHCIDGVCQHAKGWCMVQAVRQDAIAATGIDPAQATLDAFQRDLMGYFLPETRAIWLRTDGPDVIRAEPRTEGRHARLLQRTSSAGCTWYLSEADHGPYNGQHRRPHAVEFTDGTVYYSKPVWRRVIADRYPDELVVPR